MALTGRAALAALLGLVPVLLVPRVVTVAGVAVVLTAAIAYDLVRAGAVSGLRLERSGATAVRLGETAEVLLHVRNAGARPVRGLLRDAWPPSAGATPRTHPVDLAPGTATTLRAVLRPTRRGDRRPDRTTVRARGPLGMAARQGRHEVPWRLRVAPAFASRRFLPEKLSRLRALDGQVAARVRGAGTEFDSLRDYSGGDDVRSIDWRATARRGAVVVRTWRPERDRRVLVVLDTGRSSAGRVGDAPRLDASLEAALLLAALASRAGDRVDLLAVDRRVRASVESAGRAALLPSLLDAVAGLEPDLVETDARLLAAQVRRRAGQRALVVLLTGIEPAGVEALLPEIAGLLQRHVVLVAAVADPRVAQLAQGRGSARAVYQAAAAERALGERRRITVLLRRRGVEVVDAPPEQLAPALADAYLAAKSAGRL